MCLIKLIINYFKVIEGAISVESFKNTPKIRKGEQKSADGSAKIRTRTIEAARTKVQAVNHYTNEAVNELCSTKVNHIVTLLASRSRMRYR